MTESIIFLMEVVLVATTAVGLSLSAALTVDSWLRWLHVRHLLPTNPFPRVHLRSDCALLVVQAIMATISAVWFSHLRHDDAARLLATHVWPVFPLRLMLVVVVTTAQLLNAWDRHVLSLRPDSVDSPPAPSPPE